MKRIVIALFSCVLLSGVALAEEAIYDENTDELLEEALAEGEEILEPVDLEEGDLEASAVRVSTYKCSRFAYASARAECLRGFRYSENFLMNLKHQGDSKQVACKKHIYHFNHHVKYHYARPFRAGYVAYGEQVCRPN
ncbi:MAG: hypothetical protein A2284_05355 [Deltaproteobacteria bacterium RIFOXYA12_FULL_61_11]|nr:MAG: hypothetical protein A2284_05355 [Deltaproteobacteria bacterium RIFOXYA12_FULL_61_11]